MRFDTFFEKAASRANDVIYATMDDDDVRPVTGATDKDVEHMEPADADAEAVNTDAGDDDKTTDARHGRLGRGLEWLPLEFVLLSKAYRTVTLDSVKGTDQRAPQYEAAVADKFRGLLNNSGLRNIDKRKQRSTKAIMRTLRYKVFPDVLKIKDSYLAVTRRKMTGNLTEEQMENAAIAHFNGVRGGDLYASATRPEVMATLKCKHMESFKVLRGMDKFSTAVGMMATPPTPAAARPTGAAGRGDEIFASSSGESDAGVHKPRFGGTAKSAARTSGQFQDRPTGSKAAKAACKAEMQQQREMAAMQRESAANTAALQALAASAKERSSILFWSSAEASKSPYAADYWKAAIAAHRHDTDVLCQPGGSAKDKAAGAPSNKGGDNAIKDNQVRGRVRAAVEDVDAAGDGEVQVVASINDGVRGVGGPHKGHDAATEPDGHATAQQTTDAAAHDGAGKANTTANKHSRARPPSSRQARSASQRPLLRNYEKSHSPSSSDDDELDRRVGRMPAKWPRPTTSIVKAAAEALLFSRGAHSSSRVAPSTARPPPPSSRGRASQATKQKQFTSSKTAAAPAIDVEDVSHCGMDTPSPPSSPPSGGNSSSDDKEAAGADEAEDSATA